MGINNTENKTPSKKRLSLGDSKGDKARETLCKLMRARYNNQIDSATFRDLVYGFNTLLAKDKNIQDSERDKRIEKLEQLIKGDGVTQITEKEIDNPYAQSLKKQLSEMEKIKNEIEKRLMEANREIKSLKDLMQP